MRSSIRLNIALRLASSCSTTALLVEVLELLAVEERPVIDADLVGPEPDEIFGGINAAGKVHQHQFQGLVGVTLGLVAKGPIGRFLGGLDFNRDSGLAPGLPG